MNQKAQNRPSNPQQPRHGLLGALVALIVAGVLLPGDAATAPQGAGLPLVMVTLLLAVAYCGLALVRRIDVAPLGLVEWAVVALVVCQGIAALAARSYGLRPANNMFWQWAGLGVGFLLARQLIRTAEDCRAVVAVMLTLAVLQSLYGGWQLAVAMPAARAEYERKKALDPETPIPGLGYVNATTRADYEARLATPEPTGTFVLTNSLAGWLASWLVVGVGVAIGAAKSAMSPQRVIVPLVVGLLLIAACLYQTHSRTAQIATAVGCLLLPLVVGIRPVLRAGLAFLVAILLYLGLAALSKGMGGPLSQLSGARLSLVYRLEYWQATWAMIRDHWLLGVGPGQFSNFYTRYMLPQARETITDPHNFLLEVLTTAGVPAAVALIVALAAHFVRALRAPSANPDASEIAQQATTNRATNAQGGSFAVAVGAGVGLVLAYLLGRFYLPVVASTYDGRVIAVGLIAGAAMVWALWPWVRRGSLSAGLATIGSAVLLLNLLAAGGISFPGVAGSLWLLMAIGLCLTSHSSPRPLPQPVAALAFLAAMGIAAACQFTALMPVLSSRMPLDQAQAAFEKALATDQNVEQRKEHIRHGMTWLMEAAQGDPWDELPLHELAQRRWREWLEHPSEDREEAFLLAYGHWMAVARGSASLHKLAGDWFLQAHARPDTAEMQPPPIQRAVDEYRKAVKLYPNSSLFRAQLAWAENLAGNRQEARAAAEEALRLDALNPHADRRLGYPLVRISGDPQVKEVPPLELMQRILRIDAPSPSPLK